MNARCRPFGFRILKQLRKQLDVRLFSSDSKMAKRFMKEEGLVSSHEPIEKLLLFSIVKSRQRHTIQRTLSSYIEGKKVEISEAIEQFQKVTDIKHDEMEKVIENFGIDAVRLYFIINAASNHNILWMNEDIERCMNFLNELHKYIKAPTHTSSDMDPKFGDREIISLEKKLYILRNRNVLRITNFFQNSLFPQASRALQAYFHDIANIGKLIGSNAELERSLRALILMLSPLCPNTCIDLWETLNSCSVLPEMSKISENEWPTLDPAFPVTVQWQVNFVKMSELTLPYKEFSSLNKDTSSSLAKQDSKIANLLSETIVLETEFRTSDTKPSFNFITKKRKDIFRDLICEFLVKRGKEILVTVRVPQEAYANLTKERAIEFAWDKDEVRRLMTVYGLTASSFEHVPNGVSKISYSMRKRQDLDPPMPPRGKRI